MSRSTRGIRSRAFSLAEVMVFCLLLLLLTQGMYLVLVGGLRNVQYSQAYQTAQQNALLAIRRLVGELSDARSDPALLAYTNAPPNGSRIVFLSAFPPATTPPGYPHPRGVMAHDDTTGDLHWQKWVGYNIGGPSIPSRPENGNDLVRQENPAGLGAHGLTLEGATSTISPPTLPGAGWINQSVVARNIYSLEFDCASGSSRPIGLTVTLYAQDATASDRFTRVRYAVTAWISN